MYVPELKSLIEEARKNNNFIGYHNITGLKYYFPNDKSLLEIDNIDNLKIFSTQEVITYLSNELSNLNLIYSKKVAEFVIFMDKLDRYLHPEYGEQEELLL